MLITNISKLYDADAEKANQLFRSLEHTTPKAARNAIRSNSALTKQLLFVIDGTIGVLTFPTITTDTNNALRVIGSFGDDVDNISPAAFQGDLIHQSVSCLVPKAMAIKYKLSTLVVDPLELDPPAPSIASPGPARLHYNFTTPENTPVIAALPATFSVPIGITAPTAWLLNVGEISEADFPCEAGRAWVNAVGHANAHHNGGCIHLDPLVFVPSDLELGPFADHDMAPTIRAAVVMLMPTDEQYKYVQTIAKEEIKARKDLTNPSTNTSNNSNQDPVDHAKGLDNQAKQMTELVRVAIEASGKSKESRSDKEATSTIADGIARYRLMFASIIDTRDVDNPGVKTQTVVLPEINPIFHTIMETSKLADAVRMTQDEFQHHLSQRNDSLLHQDASIDYNIFSLDGATVSALK